MSIIVPAVVMSLFTALMLGLGFRVPHLTRSPSALITVLMRLLPPVVMNVHYYLEWLLHLQMVESYGLIPASCDVHILQCTCTADEVSRASFVLQHLMEHLWSVGALPHLRELRIQGHLPPSCCAFRLRRIRAENLTVLALPEVFANDDVLR